jgi:hypothetical protein
MSKINRTETIFIQEAALLPAALSIESDEFLPGWRVLKNMDRHALARQIESANWNFFYLAGDIRAIVLGRDRSSTLRRAVKRVLAKRKEQKFNCLEITNVVSKRFLGIPFMSVAAHSRHIQESIYLVPIKDLAARMPAAAAPRATLDNGERQQHEELATKQYTALFSSH